MDFGAWFNIRELASYFLVTEKERVRQYKYISCIVASKSLERAKSLSAIPVCLLLVRVCLCLKIRFLNFEMHWSCAKRIIMECTIKCDKTCSILILYASRMKNASNYRPIDQSTEQERKKTTHKDIQIRFPKIVCLHHISGFDLYFRVFFLFLCLFLFFSLAITRYAAVAFIVIVAASFFYSDTVYSCNAGPEWKISNETKIKREDDEEEKNKFG